METMTYAYNEYGIEQSTDYSYIPEVKYECSYFEEIGKRNTSINVKNGNLPRDDCWFRVVCAL